MEPLCPQSNLSVFCCSGGWLLSRAIISLVWHCNYSASPFYELKTCVVSSVPSSAVCLAQVHLEEESHHGICTQCSAVVCTFHFGSVYHCELTELNVFGVSTYHSYYTYCCSKCFFFGPVWFSYNILNIFLNIFSFLPCVMRVFCVTLRNKHFFVFQVFYHYAYNKCSCFQKRKEKWGVNYHTILVLFTLLRQNTVTRSSLWERVFDLAHISRLESITKGKPRQQEPKAAIFPVTSRNNTLMYRCLYSARFFSYGLEPGLKR